MIRTALPVLFLVGLYDSALAQEACPAAPPPPDPCMVGNWVGQNTAAEKINAMLRSMPAVNADRTVFPTVPASLGMSIWSDGFYATLPIHQNVTWQDISEDDTTTVVLDLTTTSQFGHIWGDGGQLRFCSLGGSAHLQGDIQSGSGGGNFAMPVPSGGGFTPQISYACAGGSFSFTVTLPAPIGPVDYYLVRVPANRFDDSFRDLLDGRLPVE